MFLAWNDMNQQLLKEMKRLMLRKGFEQFPWLTNNEAFVNWKKGLTGYPLVDAGMRELNETGMIHNRVRMVVASFLVKHLLISWTRGYSFFSETLVDFDVANNALGWDCRVRY